MPCRGSGRERDEWLSTDYCQRCDPLCIPDHPKRQKRAPEQAPPAYGRYGALIDEVPEEDMEWDVNGADGHPMENFRITPARGKATRSRRPEPPVQQGEVVHGRSTTRSPGRGVRGGAVARLR